MKGIILALFCAAWGIVSEAGVYRIKRNNIRPMGLPLRRASPASLILRAATETVEDQEEAKLPLPEELEDSLIIILMEGPNGFLQVLTIPMDELNQPIKGAEKGQQPGRLERVSYAGQGSTQIRSVLGALQARQPGQRVYLAKADDVVEPAEEEKPMKPPPLVIFLLQDSLEGPEDEKPSEGEVDLLMLLPIEEAPAEKNPATRWMPLQALGKRKRPVRTSPRDDRVTAYLNSLRTPFMVRN